jgi:lysophospholipase L1-like esterase
MCTRVLGRLASLRLVVLFVALFAAQLAAAAPVVILGDSWGVLVGPSVRTVLDANGYSSLAIHNASIGGSRASQWAADQFGTMDQILLNDGDARFIHLIVGGNDLLGGLADPVTALNNAVANTTTVLHKIADASTAPILFSGYEWLAVPPPGFSSPLANAFLDLYVNNVIANIAADPALSARVTGLNTHGLMQVAFGIPQLGIPAGDPSLPNNQLPSPNTVFADQIHLTRPGYDVLATDLYSQFYGPALAIPEPSTAVLLLAGLSVLAARRRSKKEISPIR